MVIHLHPVRQIFFACLCEFYHTVGYVLQTLNNIILAVSVEELCAHAIKHVEDVLVHARTFRVVMHLEVWYGPVDLVAWSVQDVFAALEHTGAEWARHGLALVESDIVYVSLSSRIVVKGVHVPFVTICNVEHDAEA